MLELIEQLKADILNGALPRGCPLRQQELSARYNVSRIPVRDAIAQLKNQGWLVTHGKAGVMVPELNWREAEDLCQVQLLEHALPNLTHEVLGRAKDINLQLNNPCLTLLERGQLNWDLHATLYEVANRPTLFNVVAILNEQVRRYMGFQYGPLNYRDTSQNEHEKLISLIESDQKDQALRYLKGHIEVAGRMLVDYLKNEN